MDKARVLVLGLSWTRLVCLCLGSGGQGSCACAWAQVDKQHVEGMEVYSTVLWHLRRDIDLSYLAQDLVAVDRLAPQVCVCGWG